MENGDGRRGRSETGMQKYKFIHVITLGFFFFFLTEEIYLFNDFSLAESDMVFPSLCTHFLGLKSTIHTSQHEMCRRGSHAEFIESKTLPVIPPEQKNAATNPCMMPLTLIHVHLLGF